MSKKLTALLMAVCFILSSFSFAVSAEDTGSSATGTAVTAEVQPADGAYNKIKTYESGSFSDINDSDWFAKEVVSAYEIGLMNGKGDGVFDPSGNVTVAEAIAVAARMHSKYYGGTGVFEQGTPWYQVYVDYAIEKGIIAQGEYDNYTRNIKRYEMGTLFAHTLPATYYNAINHVYSIPDVSTYSGYAEELLLLYNAGIIMGNDTYGTFYPNADIKRSEVSAIINRVAIKGNRLQKELKVQTTGEALYLIDDNEHPFSGWDFDNRGQFYTAKGVYASYSFTDVSEVYPSMLKRDFVPQEKGTLTLEGNFTINTAANGFVYRIADNDNNNAFRLTAKDGFYYLSLNDGTQVKAGPITGKKTSLKVVLDLDSKTYDAYLDNTLCGNFAFANTTGALRKLYIGYDEAGTGKADIAGVKLYVNYSVNERFLAPFADIVPADWKVTSANGTPAVKTIKTPNNTFSLEDIYVLKMDNAAGDVTNFTKSFPTLTGNTCYETKFILPTAANGVSFAIGSGETPAFRVVTSDGLLKTGDGTTIRAYAANVWNTLHIELNTAAQTAFVRFNGKDIGTYPLEHAASSFDTVSIQMATSDAATMNLDDILVSPIVPTPADYCPTPEPVDSTNYYVGLHVCNLWRNGFWRGSNAAWDILTAFDELTPYMGYYDEGIPEVADWEIKWLAEHGVDYQLMCWYAPANITEPVKFAGFSQALNDGFMNAKYKSYSKFAIMWENNFTDKITAEQFEKSLVPYWIEYYFSDPSYMVIDNKPVFSIYNFDKIITYFGGIEQAKAEMDYLRQQVKNLGFDDLILLFAGAGADGARVKRLEQVGADGSYAYNWGPPSYVADYQKSVITSVSNTFADASSKVVHIPTVGVGFNAVARADKRTPSISLDEYDKILTWTKDTLLTNTKYYPDQNSWQSKSLLLSCWNEYDEGHYINPSNLYGFGFLDTLRKVFTANPAHTDAKPTDNQVSRLQIMAPKDRAVLRPQRRLVKEIPTGEENIVKKWDFTNATQAKEWSLMNSTDAKYENGFSASSTGNDPIIKLADKSLNIDTSLISYIHVRYKSTPVSGKSSENAQVYFTTDKGSSWSGTQCSSATVKTGETVDAFFDLSTSGAWFGTLTSLRFDPMTENGTYQIESIELLKDSVQPSLTIDGAKVNIDLPIDMANGHNMYPMNPKTPILNSLNVYYEWNKTTQTMMIQADNTVFNFTIGSDTAIINGQNVKLYAAPYLVDGIPMIPLDILCQYAPGYSYTRTSDTTAEVKTTIYESMKQINEYDSSRVANQWEFELQGNAENWKPAGTISSVVENGCFNAKTSDTANDPNISYGESLAINSTEYTKIVVRMKHTLYTADSGSACIYFAPVNKSLGEAMTVKVPLKGKTSGDDFVEYVFDMSSNANWAGVIEKIRFDPFGTAGEFSVDYIRFEK